MTPARIVPSLDELEDGHAGFVPGCEPPAVDERAFDGREEALAQRTPWFQPGNLFARAE